MWKSEKRQNSNQSSNFGCNWTSSFIAKTGDQKQETFLGITYSVFSRYILLEYGNFPVVWNGFDLILTKTGSEPGFAVRNIKEIKQRGNTVA